MKVLVACEYSGTVRDAFIALGHDAISCDLLPTDKAGPHYQGDVFDIINDGWDIMIAHPPCTFLCNSGVSWLHKDPARKEKLKSGADFFSRLLQCCIPRIAIENPIMHGHARRLIKVSPCQIIQPWQFGHGETKATCLWLKNLPRLKPTKIVEGRKQRLHLLPPSPDRWKIRSTTFSGIASAMAEQWSKPYQSQLLLFDHSRSDES